MISPPLLTWLNVIVAQGASVVLLQWLGNETVILGDVSTVLIVVYRLITTGARRELAVIEGEGAVPNYRWGRTGPGQLPS